MLDYFGGQSNLTPIWAWEHGAHFERGSVQFMVYVAKEAALTPSLATQYPIGSPYSLAGAVMKQFPEGECFRDIAFYFKYFLNIDPRAFISLAVGNDPYSSYQLKLNWGVSNQSYTVTVLDGSFELYCKPRCPLTWGSGHRWPSFATPSALTYPHGVKTEDDVLHVRQLPTFNGALHAQVG